MTQLLPRTKLELLECIFVHLMFSQYYSIVLKGESLEALALLDMRETVD